MPAHSFVLVLDGVEMGGTDLEDRVHGCGCDDATLSLQGGVVRLDFDREASSLDDAVRSAIADLEGAGIAARLDGEAVGPLTA